MASLVGIALEEEGRQDAVLLLAADRRPFGLY